ncbi:MAG: hypothetical protein AAF551_06850 [Bacteroidota bacterium]
MPLQKRQGVHTSVPFGFCGEKLSSIEAIASMNWYATKREMI